jgi:hypothetical protein
MSNALGIESARRQPAHNSAYRQLAFRSLSDRRDMMTSHWEVNRQRAAFRQQNRLGFLQKKADKPASNEED